MPGDPTLDAEREHLARSRLALAALREASLSHEDTLAGNTVSTAHLKRA